jgi:hypothetical protein
MRPISSAARALSQSRIMAVASSAVTASYSSGVMPESAGRLAAAYSFTSFQPSSRYRAKSPGLLSISAFIMASSNIRMSLHLPWRKVYPQKKNTNYLICLNNNINFAKYNENTTFYGVPKDSSAAPGSVIRGRRPCLPAARYQPPGTQVLCV